MDHQSAPSAGLNTEPLAAGLREVVSGWSGEGTIFGAFAAFEPAEALSWTAADIRRRAQRVLLGLVRGHVAALPSTVGRWQEYLPQTTVARRVTTGQVIGRVDWSRTVRRHGWPTQQFESRDHSRVVDEVTIRTLAWLTAELHRTVDAAGSLAPVTADEISAQLAVIDATLASYPEVTGGRPDRLDIASLAGAGFPWTAVSRSAELVSRSERDPEFIAFELIAPEPDLAWRLFHLAVFGTVMRTLNAHRFKVTWRRPLGGSAPGAHVDASSPSGKQYDLWFEAAAARSHYKLAASPYPTVTEPIAGVGDPLGVDVMLVEPHRRALLLECKWSNSPSYVGRYGYHQAACYALEARAGMADQVWSFIVGPDEMVTENSVSDSLAATTNVVLGATSPSRLHDVIAGFLADDPSTV